MEVIDLYFNLLECGKDVQLETKDVIKCTFCGYRILNKKRKVDLKNPP